MAGEARPRTLIVKIGAGGDVFVNFKPASLEQLRTAVNELSQAGGYVTYYRESPYAEASEAAAATFRQLAELKPRILLGTKAPSEWGRLDWVEVQLNPSMSRVFFARGKKFLLSPEPSAQRPKPVVVVGGPLTGENEDRVFKEIDLLIRADRVLETPQVASDLAMDEARKTANELHLRLAYAARRWASAYPANAIPSNIEAFYRDLWWLVDRTFGDAAASGKKITGQDALELIKQAQ